MPLLQANPVELGAAANGSGQGRRLASYRVVGCRTGIPPFGAAANTWWWPFICAEGARERSKRSFLVFPHHCRRPSADGCGRLSRIPEPFWYSQRGAVSEEESMLSAEVIAIVDVGVALLSVLVPSLLAQGRRLDRVEAPDRAHQGHAAFPGRAHSPHQGGVTTRGA